MEGNRQFFCDIGLVKISGLDDIVIAASKKPIIGTCALATCIGLIAYDNTNY